MLYESPHVRVETADGVATLWLAFPGTPVNALTPVRLAEVGRAVGAVARNPHLDVLAIRSGRPAGFCGGHDPTALAAETDLTAFARAGQRELNQLATVEPATVAFLEGPCLGPGLELALACDYRVAVGGPDSWLGFPDGIPPCWGGSVRLTRLLGRRANRLLAGERVTAREAQRLGLVDVACSARRGKIELRTLLDRLQCHPRKRANAAEADGLAAERIRFRSPAVAAALTALRAEPPPTPEPLPELIGLVGTSPALLALAAEAAFRGSRVAIVGPGDGPASLPWAAAVSQGRVTPLEADEARRRVIPTAELDLLADAGLVIADHAPPPLERLLRPRTVLAVPATDLDPPAGWFRPHRMVGLDFPTAGVAEVTPGPQTDPGTVTLLGGWLRRLGSSVRDFRLSRPARSFAPHRPRLVTRL